MTKSRDEIELEKLVEIDGEYCIPHELNEARHVVDWGPFEPPRSGWYIVHKFLLFIPAMYLFILAVQIMKAGAAAMGPQIQGEFPFANGISTLGFGWLGAYFVLSGSPVAATAITLFGAGTLTKLQTFTMLSGSRLGASFIVLLTGFIYALRNRHDPNRKEPIGMGIQAITMTALTPATGRIKGSGDSAGVVAAASASRIAPRTTCAASPAPSRTNRACRALPMSTRNASRGTLPGTPSSGPLWKRSATAAGAGLPSGYGRSTPSPTRLLVTPTCGWPPTNASVAR